MLYRRETLRGVLMKTLLKSHSYHLIKQKIEDFAATSTLTISATQDQQVFHVPPKKPSLDDRIRSSEASNTNKYSSNKTEKDIERE